MRLNANRTQMLKIALAFSFSMAGSVFTHNFMRVYQRFRYTLFLLSCSLLRARSAGDLAIVKSNGAT
jgi:hypothetical protein